MAISTERLEQIKGQNPQPLEAWGVLAAAIFRLYFILIRW